LGEHVKGLIQLAEKVALVVPRTAVLPDDEEFVLYTVKDGKAVKHVVTLGISSGDLVEVEGQDLHDGDAVVTLGNYELTDGMAIQAKEKETGKAETSKEGADESHAKGSGKAGEEIKAGKEAKS
jgi:multidrug efflux pump subunit AcrA (membrane-fusion protein)